MLSDRGITCDRPVVRTVETDDLGQHMRIARIGLRLRGAVPFAVAGSLNRVDRPHLVAGRDQRLHPRTTVGLDPDQHLVRILVVAEMIRDQGVQIRDPDDPFEKPAAQEHPTGPVLQLDVVMGFSPVVPQKQHLSQPTFHSTTAARAACEKTRAT